MTLAAALTILSGSSDMLLVPDLSDTGPSPDQLAEASRTVISWLKVTFDQVNVMAFDHSKATVALTRIQTLVDYWQDFLPPPEV